MDEQGPSELPLRAPKRRPKSRIKVSTLKRLSTIPPHKVRHDNRHFPTGVLIGGGSNNRSVFQELLKGNAEPKRPSSADTDGDGDRSSESANERRKRFLTMSNLKRVFRALDLSDDGYIDVDELFEAIKKIRGSLTHAEIADVVWEVDDDRDGKLSMQDYLSTYRRSQADESGFEPKVTARQRQQEGCVCQWVGPTGACRRVDVLRAALLCHRRVFAHGSRPVRRGLARRSHDDDLRAAGGQRAHRTPPSTNVCRTRHPETAAHASAHRRAPTTLPT
jgi:hypothetical protein